MSRLLFVSMVGLALIAMALSGGPVAAAEKKGMRRSLGEPLETVQTLLQETKYEAALEKLEEISKSLEDPTPYEAYVLDRMRGSAATGANDYTTAIEAYRRVLASDQLPEEERAPIVNATARMAYTARMYDEAIDLIREYRELGGEDPQTLSLLPQALYVTDRHAEAAQVLKRRIEAVEKAGDKPDEYQLQLLSSTQVKSGDIRGYLETLRKSVIHYPSHEYWDELIGSTVDFYNIPQRLMLQVYRLRQWTGTLNTASDYMAATQSALDKGFAREARQFIERGFESGELGNGTPAEVNRHQRLQRHVERKVAEDKRLLGRGEELARKKKGGDALVNTGFNYITYGEYDKGVALIRDGIEKGGLRHPAQARLLYGYGLLLAGESDAALAVFSGVRDNGPAHALARLWDLAVRHNGPSQ